MNLVPLAAALALLLTACGGGGDEATGAPELPAEAAIVWPLYADDGSLMPAVPQAIPADAGAQVSSGLYAQRAQAEMLDRALSGRTVWVDAECCDAMSVEFAVATAQVLQISLALDNDAPVFVSGGTPRQSAAVADALAAGGMRRVYLVID